MSLQASDNPLQGRNSWSGNSSGYITTTVQLPASALDQSVALRWRLGSDSSVSSVGWRIDTISLEAVATSDFGDAPASYPVTLAQDGARHTIGALYLGASVSAENDGVPSATANSDASDNGVSIVNTLAPGVDETVTVVASQAGGILNAWIDWNRDGDWSDAGEKVFSDVALSAGSNTLTLNVPSTQTLGNVFGRFRVSSVAGLSVTGPAIDGEVEDYAFLVADRSWTPLGPFGATNGQVEGIANRPVTGAINAILAHPTNADIVYVGAVNGGVWKTTNATAAQPNWTPLTDTAGSQSIGSLAFDRSDTTYNTIYAGIGKYSSYAQLGNKRIGLLKSVDGGQSWQLVNGNGILNGKNISGIVANGNNIVVSVNVADSFTYSNVGIFRSTNGGASFTQMSVGNGSSTGLPGGVSYDLVADPANANILYTSTVFSPGVGGANGIYKSVNGGLTWSKVSNSTIEALITNNTSNLKIAVGNQNQVYAAIVNAGAFTALFRSPDNGTNWVQMDNPKTNENGVDVGLNPSGGKGPSSGAPESIAGGQGGLHFSMVADPNNANIVYVGGDRQPRTNGDTGGFPNSIGAQDFTGRLFRGDASKPAGTQFVHLTHTANAGGLAGGGTASNSAPHADSRDMVFDAAGNLLEVDDGGVYRRSNPLSNTGDWFSMIGDLQVTEAHDVLWDSLSNVAMTGNQDTGTTFQPSQGATEWQSLSTADGGDVAVDNIVLAGSNQSVRYTSFQNLGAFRRTVWNAAGQLVSTTFPSLSPLNGAPLISPTFRTPIETNRVAGNRVLIQGSNGLYESLNGGSSVSLIGASAGAADIIANALVYGGRKNGVDNPNVVWAGAGSNLYLRSSGGGNVSQVSSPTGSSIRDIATNVNDWENAFIVDNNQVFQTINAGLNWSDITGNLMSLASEIFSVSYVLGPLSGAIVAGTNAGVFATSTLNVGAWLPFSSSLPVVPVLNIEYSQSDDVLVAGTFGRGAWILNEVSSLLEQPASVVGRQVFYNNSTGYGGNAIAPDKVALLPGQSSSFANYTNYVLGLNGLVIDIKDLPSTLTPAQMLDNLQFARWDGIDANGFVSLPSGANPTVQSIVAGAGVGGSTRVFVTFADNSLRNTWVRTTVLANTTTRLPSNDVFYFGNVVADFNVGNTATRLRVNAQDTSMVRNNQSVLPNSVVVTNIYDVNRDGRVDAADTSLVRNNQQVLGIVAPISVALPAIQNALSPRSIVAGQPSNIAVQPLEQPAPHPWSALVNTLNRLNRLSPRLCG